MFPLLEIPYELLHIVKEDENERGPETPKIVRYEALIKTVDALMAAGFTDAVDYAGVISLLRRQPSL